MNNANNDNQILINIAKSAIISGDREKRCEAFELIVKTLKGEDLTALAVAVLDDLAGEKT